MKILSDIDFWKEVLLTIKEMRGRSLMTAFGVFWGIFLLTLLVGAGVGLDNGVGGQIKDLKTNTLWLYPEETTMPYKGLGSGRQWKMNSTDEDVIRAHFGNAVENVSAMVLADYQNVSDGRQTYQYQVLGVTPQFIKAIPQRVLEGRFINDIDLWEHHKVCVIGIHIAETMFDEASEALGKMIDVNGSILQVVGVSKSINDQIRIGADLSESEFMPLPTLQTAYGLGGEVDAMMITLDDAYPMERYRSELEALIKENNGVHPDDVDALQSVSFTEQTSMFLNVISAINLLIWIVGVGTFLAGLIGISNIMLITVKERTQEIGIRRAIGAQPGMIASQILMESLVLTFLAGLTGLSLAVWVLNMVEHMLRLEANTTFTNPFVPFWTAILSLLLLVAGGILAGWLPAKRALDIQPIDALREE